MAVKLGQIIITLGVILMLVGVVFYIFIFDFLTAGEAVWTMDEMEGKFYFKPKMTGPPGSRIVDWDRSIRDFRDLGPGDTVFLKDNIADFQYNSTLGKTLVWFKSTGMGDGKIKDPDNLHRDVALALCSTADRHKPYVFFDGDVTGDLTKGQVIAIEMKVAGVKDDSEYLQQLGDPMDEGEAKGLSSSDVIDIETFLTMGLILIIAGGACLGVGAFIHFKKDVEKKPAAAGAANAPKKEVAGGAPTRQTKCPACGAGIPIPPGAASIKCASCGKSYQIGAGASGAAAQRRPAAAPAQAARQQKCPGCGTMIAIPPGASTIKCTGCGRSYNIGGAQRPAAAPAAAQRQPGAAPQQQAAPQQAGARQSRCPGCGGNIVIPAGAKNVTCPSCKQSFRVG